MKEKTISLGNNTKAFTTEVGLFTYNTGYNATTSGMNISGFGNSRTWEQYPSTFGGYKIVNFGPNNDLPQVIRDVMETNHLAPGILNREIGLLYGDGPQLYEVVFENGEISRKYVNDSEIWNWLKSWNYRRYIEMAVVEYKYMNGIFSRQYLNRGARIGLNPMIASLEIEPNIMSRLEWVESMRLEDVQHILVGDFEFGCHKTGITAYPIFDKNNPFKNRVSMSYHNSYTFARNFYSMPSYYGALRWIMRGSDIPEIIKYLTENAISAAFHIHSPAAYWNDKTEKLQQMYPTEDDSAIARRLDKLQEETFDVVKNVLSGKKNAGKFITTVDFIDPDSRELVSWKIEPIDQKIKDFIEAQLKISGEATSATTSGLGLHPSLSNIVVGGQLSSGGQMLYALKLYLASDTTIAEEVIFENINQAIEVNFPGKNLKLGFYHSIIKTEDETAPADRIKNNV